MLRRVAVLGVLATILASGCGPTDPLESTGPKLAVSPWGPESPNFNLEVILRGENGGFGHVKFRQPNDDLLVVNLDTWVRDLAPNTAYVLQRAVDANVDGECSSNSWLTLGKGTTAQAIVTDDAGTGREELWRSVAAFPVGTTFDIHFQVVLESDHSVVVLESDCYQFTISQ